MDDIEIHIEPPILASLADRLVGQILDGVVAVIPLFGVMALSGASGRLGAILLPFTTFVAVFYIWFSDGFSHGQSYGKRIVHTAVVDRTTGEPCTFGQSFVRNFLLSVLGPIDWIFIFGQRRERLGDKAANTRVIKLSP